MTEQTSKPNVWVTRSSAHGLSSSVTINVTMDVTDEQIREKAEKEYSRNIQAKLRGMGASEIVELNNSGTWNINASEFHVRGDMSLSRAVSNVKTNVTKMSPEDRAALIAALQATLDENVKTETN